MGHLLGGSTRRVRGSFGAPARVLLTAGVFLAACGGIDTGSPPPPTSSRAPRVSVSPASPLLDYELTVGKLNGLYLAHHALYRLSRRSPEPVERLQAEIDEIPPEDLDVVVGAIEREPAVREALDQARISARDFYLTQYTLVNAVMVLTARAAGRTDNLPDVSETNLEFVRRNPQAVQRVMTERRPPAS